MPGGLGGRLGIPKLPPADARSPGLAVSKERVDNCQDGHRCLRPLCSPGQAESGDIVLAVMLGREYRTLRLPTFSHLLIVNKLLSPSQWTML